MDGTPFQSVSPAEQQAQLQATAAQGGNNPMNPINTMPGADPSFDLIGNIQKLLQQPQYQAASQRLTDVGGRQKQLSAQQQDLASSMPRRQYQPNYEPITGAKSALRDVGRGVLQGLSFTGPGRAISDTYYADRPGGVRDWESKKAVLADQMKSLQGEEETAAEGMKAVTGAAGATSLAAYRGGELANVAERNRIAQERANLKGQEIKNNYQVQLERIAQGWDRLSVQEQNEKAMEWYHKGTIDAYNARTAAGQLENDARIGSNEDMKAAVQESQWMKEHPYLNLWRQFSGSQVPVSVSAPGAGSPKPTVVRPKAGAAPAAGGAAQYRRDPATKRVQQSVDGGKTWR